MSSSLESRNYVASSVHVEEITRAVLQAVSSGTSGRASYFSALLGTTIHEITNAAPRQRPTDSPRLAPAERDTQLRALEAVHLRFYSVVDKVAREKLAPGKGAARDLNRRTNFARSAMSTVRSWIRAGNDITGLAPAKTTKAMLAVETRRRRQTSAHVLAKRARKWSDQFDAAVAKLIASNEDAAREVLEARKAKIEAFLEKLGRPAQRRSGRATSETRAAA